MKGHSRFQLCVCFSLPVRGLYICLSLPSCELGDSFPSLDCVIPLVPSLFRLGRWFSPRGWLCLRGIIYILGTVVNSLESNFGHDRAKNDSGIIFPVLSCIS